MERIELWIRLDGGNMLQVVADLDEYDLSKPLARAELLNDIRAAAMNLRKRPTKTMPIATK